uniref:Uncharacterized protein n=1 Tax=Labrus bergylta TaxID=56723 RepID=A0A3Q3F238_9LABR
YSKRFYNACHTHPFTPDGSDHYVELAGCNQTDLAFNKNWHFHLTRSVDFAPPQEPSTPVGCSTAPTPTTTPGVSSPV